MEIVVLTLAGVAGVAAVERCRVSGGDGGDGGDGMVWRLSVSPLWDFPVFCGHFDRLRQRICKERENGLS